jgi:hypothetical protein
MRFLRSFALFWWNFIVGDDWRVALGLAGGLALTWLLARGDEAAWWLLPLVVAGLLVGSVWREASGSEGLRSPGRESADRPMLVATSDRKTWNEP